MALDEVEERGGVVGEARADDAARLEQGGGARGVVGLLEEEVGDADARQPRHLLVERDAERGADERRRDGDERLAPREVARDDVEQLLGRERRRVGYLHRLALRRVVRG